jgi:hypothetical protein
MIYELYGFNNEEIAFVDSKNKIQQYLKKLLKKMEYWF